MPRVAVLARFRREYPKQSPGHAGRAGLRPGRYPHGDINPSVSGTSILEPETGNPKPETD